MLCSEQQVQNPKHLKAVSPVLELLQLKYIYIIFKEGLESIWE